VAHSKSALKRWRQNERHRERNKPVRSGARGAARKARAAIASGNADEAQAAVREAAGILDRAAKRRVIHPNAASRNKSRLMRQLNRISSGAAAAEAPKRARKTAAKPAAKTAAKPRAATKPKAPAKPRATKKAADKS
jgi:small subunit ribosomal protein S20